MNLGEVIREINVEPMEWPQPVQPVQEPIREPIPESLPADA